VLIAVNTQEDVAIGLNSSLFSCQINFVLAIKRPQSHNPLQATWITSKTQTRMLFYET